MKKIKKIITIFITVLIVLINSRTYAAQTQYGGSSDKPLGPDQFNTFTTLSEFDDAGGKVIGLISSIGTIISIGVLMILGIKYMMGSVEEKAEYKKSMIPYVVGAVLLFAAVNIAQVVVNVAKSFR